MGVDSVAEPAAEFESSDRYLERAMSLQQILFISMSGIIGSGWLFAVLAADGVAGPASVISWILGAVFILFIALNYAEIAGMLPRSGAIVRYPHLSHGSYTGFIMGWAYLIAAFATPAIEAEAVVTYLASKFSHAGFTTVVSGVTVLAWPTGILLGILLLAIFFVVNYFGIRYMSRFNQWITWWKLVIPCLTFILLFAAFHGSTFTKFGGFAPFGVSPIFQALATSGIIFAYSGFRQGLEYGGEARDPQRTVPIATIFSIVIALVIYVGLQIAFTGALNFHNAGIAPGAWSKLAGSGWANGPLYSSLKASNIALLGAFGTVLLIDAAISPSATGWVYLGTSARAFYGMSVDGYFPRFFQWMNNFSVPWLAVAASSVFSVLLFLPLPSWYQLVSFTTSATVLTYIMGGAGLPVLRRTAPGLYRPFRLPVTWLLSPLGFLAAVMIFYWSGFSILVNVTAAIFIGLALFVWFYAPRQGWFSAPVGAVLGIVFIVAWVLLDKAAGYVLGTSPYPHAMNFPLYFALLAVILVAFTAAVWLLGNEEARQSVNASWWLIFLALAGLLLSYYGEYGPLAKPRLAFPVSDIIAVIIGLISYYWAIAVGFAPNEMRQIIAASEAPGAPGALPEPAGDAG